MPSSARKQVEELLTAAGVRVNGGRRWDPEVHDERFYERVLAGGSLGAGESYMDGWWDVEALDEFSERVNRARLAGRIPALGVTRLALKGRLFNRQGRSRSWRVAREHYDLGNDLFERMLDRNMQYTCGYWDGASDLDQAQENKIRLICRKIHLGRGMKVLELGSGFGGLARWMAAECGCEVASFNISREQVEYAREWCAGLPVRFELKDYREAAGEKERFDRVVAIGLCEHVGYKNYPAFLGLARSLVKPEGLFLLHSIGGNESVTATDPWTDRYIFPGGMIPSIAQLGRAMEKRWVMEDWHNFGPDYDRTLLAWQERFERAWPELREKYGERFRRMWRYYLLMSAGRFRARRLQLWQIVLSQGDLARYASVR